MPLSEHHVEGLYKVVMGVNLRLSRVVFHNRSLPVVRRGESALGLSC